MFPFLEIFIMILQGIPSSLFNPYFWIVVLLVWMQYKRTASLEESITGTIRWEPRRKVLYSVLTGVIGGLIGSAIVMVIGLSISEVGLIYVWPLALILAIVDPHYMCFSYAGGIVSLFSLVFGFPKIDVPGLMALVAILHMVESLLIYFSGHLNSTPIYMKDAKYGIIGGFSLQEFWPVPIILLIAMAGPLPPEEVLQMPDWWPLIKPPSHILQDTKTVFMMFPVVAALGYGDIALTTTPQRRTTKSALHLSIFSLFLLILSVMASRQRIYKFIAATFAPLAHELLIILGRRREQNNPPLFTPSSRGERVLYVKENTFGEKLGLSPGDLILKLNGQDLSPPNQLEKILGDYPTFLWIDFITPEGEVKTREIKAYPHGIGDLGLVFVPRGRQVPTVELQKRATLSRLLQRFRRRN